MASSSSSSLALLLLLTMITSSWAARSTAQDDLLMMDRFERWMEEHSRSYPTAEEKLRRFEIYRHNVRHIEATNREGNRSYILGENQFTDLTSEEFLATYTSRIVLPPEVTEDDGGMVITTRAGDVTEGHATVNLSAVPASVDWRQKGAVTPVRYQGTCASCYAFATVAAVEALNQIKTGNLVSLSEQQLVDCTGFGCSAGYMLDTYNWIANNGGITTAADYPYTAKVGTCDKSKLPHHAVSIRGVRSVSSRNEALLMQAVAQQPVTVGIEASADFQNYKSGVFSGPCGYGLNHAVTLVGYGTDAASGKKYWIAKNSYSQRWGIGGYIYMERDYADRRGLCGLAMFPDYPVA